MNSKARADWHARYDYEFKCCRFKRQVLRQDNWTLIGSRLHSSQIATCRVSGEVWFWMIQSHARLQEFTESQRIRKIIWIIFSTINNINSALHLTQTYCIRQRGLRLQRIVIWITFGSAFDIFAIIVNNDCNCIYLSVMFFLYCTEIAMFRFRCRSGISDNNKNCNAILLLKWLFSCIFRSIAFYILLHLL